MGPVRETLDHVLSSQEPYPARVVDRHWGIITYKAVSLLTEGSAPELLEPPANVLRLALHPDGVAPRIVKLAQLRGVLLQWLSREAAATGDPALEALWQELSALPGAGAPAQCGRVAVPLRIRWCAGELSFISTIATFARASDITVAELSIESFYPTDPATAEAVREFTAEPSRELVAG